MTLWSSSVLRFSQKWSQEMCIDTCNKISRSNFLSSNLKIILEWEHEVKIIFLKILEALNHDSKMNMK